jgi:sugar lactone lactonase YvrE
VYSTVSAAQGWEQVGESYGTVSSVAAGKDGAMYFAAAPAGRIYRVDAQGKVTTFRDAGGAGAIRVGADGLVYAAQSGRKRIVSIDGAGAEKVVAQNVEAADLAIRQDGGIYFSDPGHAAVGYIPAGGKPRVVYQGSEMAEPWGVALSPDQGMLIVTDAQARFSWSFQIAADGSLVNGEPFYRLEMPESGWKSGVRGAAEDTIGQVYFATPLGIQVCEANGRTAQILNPPEHGGIASLAFSVGEPSWLYVAEGGKVFRRQVKVKGAAAWVVVKPPRPPL